MYYDGVVFKPNLDDYFIEHHGIKGQKWGVKNGPPYPLGPNISTGKKLKTTSNGGKKKSSGSQSKKDGKYGMVIPVTLAAYVTLGVLSLTVAAIDEITLSKKEKVEYLKSKARYKKLKELRKDAAVDEKTGLKLKKNQNATREEDMEMVNALRGKRSKTKGTYDNCARCTAAYDLRRRGFEVHANYDKNRAGVSTEDIESWYKNGKHTSFKDDPTKNAADVMIKQLSKEPVGSRGNMCVSWKLGGGHSVAYEIEKKGKVTVYNTQSNQKLEGQELVDYLNHASVVNKNNGMTSWYMRTDNLEPNYDILKKKGIIKT